MSDSAHPGSDDFENGGLANGDWWELLNVSDEPIEMTGFRWDDDDRLIGDDFSVFPEFVIQPKEVVIVVNETENNVEAADGFRAAWNLPQEMRILSKTFFSDSGPENFSGLSSGGDEVNLYDVGGTLIQSLQVEAAMTGLSSTYGFVDGGYTSLGFAQAGIHGAVQSLSDGSESRIANPDFWAEDLAAGLISLDVSSAGHVEGVEVLFGGTDESNLNSVCLMVAAGTKTAEDLQAVLTTLQVLPGDADLDGSVEFADFLILSSNFGDKGTGFTEGDFNCDGETGFGDFLVLSTNFGELTTGVTSVPEPASGLPLAIVGFVVLVRRKSDRFVL